MTRLGLFGYVVWDGVKAVAVPPG